MFQIREKEFHNDLLLMVERRNTYIRYTGLGKAANITVGKQKEPFGLEELTSSKDITALERSAMTEFYDDFDGYYVQLGWVITGENRPYKDGVFKRIKPQSPAGAWEAVIRYEDGDGKYSDIGLGSGNGEQMTLAVNYYVNNYVRFGLSYMDGEQDDGNTTLEGDEVRARVQLVY